MTAEQGEKFGNVTLHGIDEIMLPDVISWWPSTIGWYFIALAVLLIALQYAFKHLKKWRRNQYRRDILKQLVLVQSEHKGELFNFVKLLPFYLKVTALEAYPRAQVAKLSGKEWLTFLDQHYSGPSFEKTIGQKMLDISYQDTDEELVSTLVLQQIITMSLSWIATHQEFDDV